MKTLSKLLLLALTGVTVNCFAQGTWLQKASYGGGVRSGATGFSIGNKGYIGTGGSSTSLTKDFWEFNPVLNLWTQRADFGGTAREQAVGFSIGSKGYIGMGMDWNNNFSKDFWEYNPADNTWTKKADFGGTGRYSAVGFSIGDKGYIGTGNDGSSQNDFWEYDTTANKWTQKAFLTGKERYDAVGFSIGNKGYIGGGAGATDFFEYNPQTDTWTQKVNLPVYLATYVAGFSIGNKGYINCSPNGNGMNFWEYDPVVNIWITKTNLPTDRGQTVGFAIGNKGYIGTGGNSSRKNDFWEYTPDTCSLTATVTASGPTTFCNGDSVVLSSGTATSYLWSNGATTKNITVKASGNYMVKIINGGCAAQSSVTTIVVDTFPKATVTVSGATAFCNGDSVKLSANNAVSYLWSNGANTSSIMAKTGGSYTVKATYANGCSATSAAITVTVNTPTASITAGGATTFCNGDSVKLSANSATSYLWSNGANTSSITTNIAGSYTVKVTDANGCSATSSAIIVTVNPLPTAIINGLLASYCTNDNVVTLSGSPSGGTFSGTGVSNNQFSPSVVGVGTYTITYSVTQNGCTGTDTIITKVTSIPSPTIIQNDTLLACSESGMSKYVWLLNGDTIAKCTNKEYCATCQKGFYTVIITNANGCSSSSAKYNNTTVVCVDIEEVANTEYIKIYPNPSNGKFTITMEDVKGKMAEGKITIYNVLGEVVFQTSNIKHQTLNIELSTALPAGIYFLQVNTGEGTININRKLVLEK